MPALLRGGWPLFVRLLALAALTAVSSVMYGASVKYAGVAVATVLSSTAPLFAVPLGVVFLHERLPALALLGAVVSVAGIVVLRL
ncbi:MAG TPA: EamA family transporter [Methylomirabilota bacterium]